MIEINRGLADLIVTNKGNNKFLNRVNKLLNWKRIEKLLSKSRSSKTDNRGRKSYPDITMFKILLLQTWFNLSDPGAEDALNDRISFMKFTGLSLSSDIPDHSTISLFRKRLLEANLYEKLFHEINKQLSHCGLIVKTGVIVDASVHESSQHPRKKTKIIAEDRKEDEVVIKSEVTYSNDIEATWLKKRGRSYYGYKSHIGVDYESGYILGGHMTPANVSDINQLENILPECELPLGCQVLGDKGYASKSNRDILSDLGFIDLIMHKKTKGKPLSIESKFINKVISSVRYKVERAFGSLKKHFGFQRLRYIGIDKANMELKLKFMAFNIKKAVFSC